MNFRQQAALAEMRDKRRGLLKKHLDAPRLNFGRVIGPLV